MIGLHSTFIDPIAKSLLAELVDSTYLSEGDWVVKFERALEDGIGLKNCVALNSGTSALHLALVLAGVESGDEVIIPAQTFIATGLAVLMQGAIPVFADINYLTGNINVESIRNKITAKTKAIIPVHWGGYPCDLDEIDLLAKANNLIVIEDAAHALGAEYKKRPIGSISDLSCFSFQAIKHLTTGDGGAICTTNNEYYKSAMVQRWFGIDRVNTMVTELGERNYNVSQLGFKYHMNNYAAVLGLANLTNFNQRLSKRREVARYYTRQLSSVNGITLFDYQSDRSSSYWLYGFHVKKRLDFIRALKARGIVASVVHQRIDRNKVFGGLRDDLKEQAKFDTTQIHIPIHDSIDMEKAYFICNAIKNGW